MVSAAFMLLTALTVPPGLYKQSHYQLGYRGHCIFLKRVTQIQQIVVSTLAVHGKYVSKVHPDAQHGCKETFCDVKPADYPEQEIDRLLMKDLSLLHRRKRESAIDVPKLEPGSPDGNCKTYVEIKKPYELRSEGQVPQVIVQSRFFSQEIPHVTCQSNAQPCFQALIRGGSSTEAKCKQKYISTILYVYDAENKAIKAIDGQIPIDCVCETA